MKPEPKATVTLGTQDLQQVLSRITTLETLVEHLAGLLAKLTANVGILATNSAETTGIVTSLVKHATKSAPSAPSPTNHH